VLFRSVEAPEPFHTSSKDLKTRTKGVMTLEVPRMIGDYRLWLYGAMRRKVLVSKPVHIEIDFAGADLSLPGGARLKPGEKFDIVFRELPNGSYYNWVAIIPADTPKNVRLEDVQGIAKQVYLKNRPEGRLTFTAPEKPGKYLLRLQDKEFMTTLRDLELVVQGPDVVETPLPAKPAPSEPIDAGKTASPNDVSGLWSVTKGAFGAITFDQVQDLLDGTFTSPDGVFQGEMSGNKLTGLWASNGQPIAQECGFARLGSRYWGRIEATISPDGAALDGAWGSCDGARIHALRAVRGAAKANVQTPPADTPSDTAPPAPAVALPLPTLSAPPAAEIPIPAPKSTAKARVTPGVAKSPRQNAKSVATVGKDGFVTLVLPPLPQDPFSRYPAPHVGLPTAADMAPLLPSPGSEFSSWQPPTDAPQAPRMTASDFPAATSWPHLALGGKTLEQVKSALDITDVQPFGWISTVHPKDPATGQFQMDKGYAVDGRAVREVFGGDETKAPPVTGWVQNGDKALSKYSRGQANGLRIRFFKGKVDEIFYPTAANHQIDLGFDTETGRLTSAETLRGWTTPDGPRYTYFPGGAPHCFYGYKANPNQDTTREEGRTACFDKDGYMVREGFFKNAKSDGVLRKFEDRKLVKLVTFANGQYEGLTVGYSNGKISRWEIYQNDKENGPYKSYSIGYDRNLFVQEAGTYENGERTGPMWSYKDDGSLYKITYFSAGKERNASVELEQDTGLIRVFNVPAGNGHGRQILNFDYDGNLERLETHDASDRIIQKLAFQGGALARRTAYKNGKMSGLDSYYSDSDTGQIMLFSVDTYLNGEKKGRYISYQWTGEIGDEGSN